MNVHQLLNDVLLGVEQGAVHGERADRYELAFDLRQPQPRPAYATRNAPPSAHTHAHRTRIRAPHAPKTPERSMDEEAAVLEARRKETLLDDGAGAPSRGDRGSASVSHSVVDSSPLAVDGAFRWGTLGEGTCTRIPILI